jgi:hypothetical protein
VKRLRWSKAAAHDLEEIGNYLHLHHSSFAVPTFSAFTIPQKISNNFHFVAARVEFPERANWC